MASDMSERITFSLSRLKRESIVLSEQQVNAVCSVLRGQDTVVCLPTGHGKSVIFEVVPWCHEVPEGLGQEGKKVVCSVIIVSPLLSLMDKQVQELVQRGQSAVRLSSQPLPSWRCSCRTALVDPWAHWNTTAFAFRKKSSSRSQETANFFFCPGK